MLAGYGKPWVTIVDSRATTGVLELIACRTSSEMASPEHLRVASLNMATGWLVQEYQVMLIVEDTRTLLLQTLEESTEELNVQAVLLSSSEAEITLAALSLVHKLAVPRVKDWAASADNGNLGKLNAARRIYSSATKDVQFELFTALSWYANPHVPWSNTTLAHAATLPENALESHAEAFTEYLKSHVINLPTAQVSAAGYKKTGFQGSGLRPTLGFRAGSAAESAARDGWLNSEHIRAVSSVVVLFLALAPPQAWPTLISFVLNVLDDSRPLIRRQGCFLVLQLASSGLGTKLVSTGLVQVCRDSVLACFSYLPTLTPAVTSLLLMAAAYPAITALLDLAGLDFTAFVDIIESNLMSLLAHVQGRSLDGAANELVCFFLDQIGDVVRRHVRYKVLVCFSRLNFLMCLLITDPFLIDADGGIEVIYAALQVQSTVLSLAENAEFASRIVTYKYDFLASWAVVSKRLEKFHVAGNDKVKRAVRENLTLLRAAADNSGDALFLLDVQQTIASVPELGVVFQ